MFKIYGLHTPMFVKAVLAAEEMNAEYSVTEVDLMKGDQKNPAHLARHPFGKVPVLEHNGKFLFESNAIMRYMATTTQSKLYPSSNYERAVVDQWIDYFSLQAGRWCTNIWFQKCIVEKYFNEPADTKLVDDLTRDLLAVMPTIDAHLAKNQWIAGKDLSLADVNAYMLMQGYKDAGVPLNDFTNFMRWCEAYGQRPAVRKVFEKWM